MKVFNRSSSSDLWLLGWHHLLVVIIRDHKSIFCELSFYFTQPIRLAICWQWPTLTVYLREILPGPEFAYVLVLWWDSGLYSKQFHVHFKSRMSPKNVMQLKYTWNGQKNCTTSNQNWRPFCQFIRCFLVQHINRSRIPVLHATENRKDTFLTFWFNK